MVHSTLHLYRLLKLTIVSQWLYLWGTSHLNLYFKVAKFPEDFHWVETACECNLFNDSISFCCCFFRYFWAVAVTIFETKLMSTSHTTVFHIDASERFHCFTWESKLSFAKEQDEKYGKKAALDLRYGAHLWAWGCGRGCCKILVPDSIESGYDFGQDRSKAWDEAEHPN